MAILWALGSAFSFGIADYLARDASQVEGSFRTLFYLQLLGTPVAAVFVVLGGGNDLWGRILTPAGLGAVLVSLVSTGAALFLYRALAKGPLLIVSPVASSFAAVTAVLSLIAGERPAPINAIGMVVTLAGVVLSAITTDETSDAMDPVSQGGVRAWVSGGVASAIGAALLFGLDFFILRYVIPTLGSQVTTLMTRVTTLAILGGLALVANRSVTLRTTSSFKWLVPMGILDTSAVLFANQGLSMGLTSIVSVTVSLFSVVTIILGFAIAKERITRVQQIGIAITLAGVALVSL